MSARVGHNVTNDENKTLKDYSHAIHDSRNRINAHKLNTSNE